MGADRDKDTEGFVPACSVLLCLVKNQGLKKKQHNKRIGEEQIGFKPTRAKGTPKATSTTLHRDSAFELPSQKEARKRCSCMEVDLQFQLIPQALLQAAVDLSSSSG